MRIPSSSITFGGIYILLGFGILGPQGTMGISGSEKRINKEG